MDNQQVCKVVVFESATESMQLLGEFDRHIQVVEQAFEVRLIPQGLTLTLEGPEREVALLGDLFQQLQNYLRKGHFISGNEFEYALKLAREDQVDQIKELFDSLVLVTPRGKQIRPKTAGQQVYLKAINYNDIVLGIGPAGTGKTYLALAMAIHALKDKQVQRLILTRPAVEAGEHLGYLPGDFQDKVEPYLRPIFDGLYDLLGVDTFQKYRDKGIIEIAPLAYMRGRTLDDSFVILDEAQNTTSEQMKMFLTRLGFGSKAVITGDVTQIDLPRHRYSGLEEAPRVLNGIKGIALIYLTEKDVVRHPLVQKIIRAYEGYELAKGKTDERNAKN